MLIDATFFGKTRKVEAELWYNNEKLDSSEVAIEEEILWVERGEDWYALMSPQLRNKMVAVVTREAWLAAEPPDEWKDQSVAKQIRLTYNAVDYKALLKKAVLLLDESDVSYLQCYFKPDEMKVLDALLEEVYNERD